MKIDEFADKAIQCEDDEELIRVYQQFMLEEGFDNYAISSFTEEGPIIHAGEVPDGWEEYYMQQEYWNIDPVFRAQASKWEPHFWNDLVDENTSKEAREFIDESEDAGLKNGHTVSLVHMGRKTNFAPSSSENLDKHTRDNCVAKTFAVSSIFAAKRALLHRQSSRIQLSQRELEVTKWIVRGLKNTEIADKMNISTKTVEEFIRRICVKNDLKNRLDIGVHAIVHNLVDIP